MKKLVITTNEGRLIDGVKEIWQFKDLLLMMSWRDFKVRYSQTTLGILWGVLQPVTSVFVFWLVFGKALSIETGEIPYAVYALSGISMWSLFSYIFSQASNSVIGAQNMIKKIYFPRLILPISKGFVGCIDFFISFLIFIGLFIYFNCSVSLNIFFLPFILALQLLFSISIGIFVSALSIRFRDVIHTIPFVIQIGLYVSPVAYPAEFVIKKVPTFLQKIYILNPEVGIIECFRWSLFGGNLNVNSLIVSIVITLILLFVSVRFFLKIEKIMSDIV